MGRKYAIKIMKSDSDKTRDEEKLIFKNEVRALRILKHPNILKMYSSSDKTSVCRADGTKLKAKYIALEYCEGGELFDYIAETGR